MARSDGLSVEAIGSPEAFPESPLAHLLNRSCFQDQFDTIDFTDNDLKKLENFPLLHRLKSLLCNNNRIR